MRALRMLALAALVALPGLAGAATGINLGARLGGQYSLMTANTDAPGSLYSSAEWTWMAELTASGGGLDPQLFTWGARLDYQRRNGWFNQSKNVFDRVGFGLNANLLSGYAVPIQLSYTRSFQDMTTDTAGARTLGTSRVTSYAGRASFSRPNLPSAYVSLTRHEDENDFAGSNRFSWKSTELSAGSKHDRQTFGYAANYRTNWDTGYAADRNFRAHAVDLAVRATLSDKSQFSLTERYFLRVPTVEALSNPRLDQSALAAFVQWRPDARTSSNFGYRYDQMMIVAADAPASQQGSHLVNANAQYALLSDLSVEGGLSANYAEASLGGVNSRGLGEALNLGLSWTRPFSWGGAYARAGGSMGLVEPSTGGVETSNGVNGQLGGRYAWGQFEASANYNGSYTTGGAAVAGSTVSQSLQVGGGYVGPKLRVRADVGANASRREDRLLGSFLGRSARASIRADWRMLTGELNGGTSDGVTAALASPGFGGGLLLPSRYNTHINYAGALAGVYLDSLTLTVNGQLSETISPNAPAVGGRLLVLNGSYSFGKIVFSVEGRLGYEQYGVSWQQSNSIWLRLERSFGLDF